MTDQPEPFVVPQDFYDMIMSLPDGTDVTEFFECADPSWIVRSMRLSKTRDSSFIACTSKLTMEVDPDAPSWRGPSADMVIVDECVAPYCAACGCPLSAEYVECTAESCWCANNLDQSQAWHSLKGEVDP